MLAEAIYRLDTLKAEVIPDGKLRDNIHLMGNRIRHKYRDYNGRWVLAKGARCAA